MQGLGTLWTSQVEVTVAATAAGIGDGLYMVVRLGIGASEQGSCPRAVPLPCHAVRGRLCVTPFGRHAGAPAVAQSPIGSPSGVGVALRPSPKPFPKR